MDPDLGKALDLLLTLVERYHDKFSGQERDSLSEVRNVLHEINDGER